MFKGSYVALITPFIDKNFDEDSFKRFINWQIDSGTEGLVVCGTTGECATMTAEEHLHVVDVCVKTAAKRVPVIAGAGSNDTMKTTYTAQTMQNLGADGLLIVTPYYNKPSQKGLFEHYKAVHDATALPIILYNVPGRTGVDMSVDTISLLAKLPRIAGIKEASADLSKVLKIRRKVPESFALLSGEDATVAAFLAQGGHGCISVTANVAPAQCAQLHAAWRTQNRAAFNSLRDKLAPLHDAMFVESNPSPVKYAASLLGYGDGSLRQPLWEISDASKEVVRSAMRSAGVL